MEKQVNSQLELFSETRDFSDNRQKTEKSFWGYISGHEKTIFMLFGFIVVGIIAFTLGVEKGKKAALAQPLANPKQAVIIQQQHPVVNLASPKAEEAEKTASVISDKPAIITQQYTIQIASFKDKERAQKEVDMLKKKGFSPVLTDKNGITVIYIGNFTNKETAKSLLSQLQKRYKDCFIRRL